MNLFQHLKDSHPFSNIGSRDRRCSGGNPHNTVSAIVPITEETTGNLTEESLDGSPHFVKHHCHGDKSLHRSDATFVELLSKVLAFGGSGESRILSELGLFCSLHNTLPKERFFARTDLDDTSFISNTRLAHICDVHLRELHHMNKFSEAQTTIVVNVALIKNTHQLLFSKIGFELVKPCHKLISGKCTIIVDIKPFKDLS
mmetsp:Transcript_5715/g.9661  ORF Transcript_5715/g.9661 Transcript_5715/m.9661 type:complete len:201 (-) Transcript_5715:256-858(-)